MSQEEYAYVVEFDAYGGFIIKAPTKKSMKELLEIVIKLKKHAHSHLDEAIR